MSRLLTWAIVAIVLVSTSCDARRRDDADDGDAAPPRTTRPRVTACTLLAADDVTRAFGAPASEPDATADEGADALAGRSGCAWATTDGEAAVLVELLRTADMSDVVRRTGFSAAARFGAARSRHPEADAATIAGAAALWVEEAATMHLLAGGNYLTFEVAVADPSRARPTATVLATAALSRLPERAD